MPPGDGPAPGWTGGTYLVARRIRMHIEVWDRTSLTEQESIIGRTKGEGAPARAGRRSSTSRTSRRRARTAARDPGDAHVRLAHRSNLGGVRILRRGYNFTDGTDGAGHLDAGCSSSPSCATRTRQFVPMQRALARARTRLNEYIEHTGSAVFAFPRGLGPQDYWGQALLEA